MKINVNRIDHHFITILHTKNLKIIVHKDGMGIIKKVRDIKLSKMDITKVIKFVAVHIINILRVDNITIMIQRVITNTVNNIKITTRKYNSVHIREIYDLINNMKIVMTRIMNQDMKSVHVLGLKIEIIIMDNK